MDIQLTEQEQLARERVCLPLDNLDNFEAVEARVKELSPVVGLFKVGKETFTQLGPDVVRMIQNHGSDVFVDLKYNDIPNTVKGAVYKATLLGPRIIDVHANAGYEAMFRARLQMEQALKENPNLKKPLLTAITVLTSLDEANILYQNMPLIEKINPSLYRDLKSIPLGEHIKLGAEKKLYEDSGSKDRFEKQDLLDLYVSRFKDLKANHSYFNELVTNQVLHFAEMAADAGLDAIVCAAQDLGTIGDRLPSGLKRITPGIKGPGAKGKAGSDQKRVYTPGVAIQAGSSILVVGRAITGYETPDEKLEAGYNVLKDMAPHMENAR